MASLRTPDGDIDAFMSDPNISELIERLRTTGDFLDIVTLSEVQHSNMLAWCLDPSEGHGQGDLVLKDFLIAAANASTASTLKTRVFFEKWTPSRIRTTSFGSAWVSREFSHVGYDGKKGRLDLFVVDPQNRLVVTIENKAGSKLRAEQLNTYWNAVNAQIAARPAFKEFDFAYVVLDQYLEEGGQEELGNRWVYLDYAWLASAARRAELQVSANNQSALLLMGYCHGLTGWENPAQREISSLAAEIAIRHERVVRRLRECRKLQLTAWTPKMFGNSDGDLLYFYYQHQHLCKTLVEAGGIAAVKTQIVHALNLEESLVESARVRMNVAPINVNKLMDKDGESWPLYLHIRQDNKPDEPTTFRLKLIWSRDCLGAHLEHEKVRTILAKRFFAVEKSERPGVRRIAVAEGLDAAAAATVAIDSLRTLEKLVAEAVVVAAA